jgi:hypothetical protein
MTAPVKPPVASMLTVTGWSDWFCQNHPWMPVNGATYTAVCEGP